MIGHANRDCACGDSIRVWGTPSSVATQIVALFDAFHKGDGHSSVDPKEAGRIRSRKRRAAARERRERANT